MIFKLQKIKRITAIYFISLFFLYRFTELPDLFYLIACILYIAIPAFGAMNIRSNFYVDAINSIANKKSVIITFNLSNEAVDIEKLLKLLNELNIKGMFFITGKLAQVKPNLIEKIYQQGHTIGSQSYDLSKRFGFYPTGKLINNIRETEKLISKISGEPIQFFRPPFGVTNPFVKNAVKTLNYKVIGWKIKFDLRKLTNKKLILRKLSRVKGGEIILVDIIETDSIELIREIIQGLKTQSYNFSILD